MSVTFYRVLITTTHAPNEERDAIVLTRCYYYQNLDNAHSEYWRQIGLHLEAYLGLATFQYERIGDVTGCECVSTIAYGTRSHVIRIDKVLLQETEM